MKAHEAFDEIWKGGAMRRTQAYAWLANMLDIEPSKCHIGMFDESQCEAVIEFSLSELLDEPMLELEVESVEIAPY